MKIDWEYWAGIATGLGFVLIAIGQKDDPGTAVFFLFAATFMLIHTKGNQILRAVKEKR